MRKFYAKTMLTALLLLCCAVASAQSFESNGISYSILSLSDRTVEVAHNSNYQGFIIIPSTTDYSGISFKVNGIGDGAFSSTKVTEMIIPEGVTYIGKSAFKSSTLKEIIIPNSVTSIGEYAFSSCTGLKSITIPNNVTTIENYAFYGCTSLTSITIPNNVTSIGEYAFSNCTGLTNITIPNNVTSIGEYAFSNCTGLTSVTIGNSVTTIGSCAFQDCTDLTSVTIGNSVTTIGEYAFSNCTGLTSITIPDSVTTIGSCAFQDCTDLTSVTIGKSVKTIENYAFYGCTKLKLVCNCSSLYCSAGFKDSGYVAYYANIVTTGEISHTILTDNYIFATIDGVSTLVAYIGSDSQISLPLEYNGTNYVIGRAAFRGNTKLTSITIPNNVTSIGEDAFSNCTGLTSVTIGNGVTTIGSCAFSYCSGLTSITIPNSVTSIGSWAFRNCTGLTSITIPNSVTSIGDDAFYRCTGLTSITIPNSVTSIGSWAFDVCSGLAIVTVDSGNTVYDSREGCNAIIETATNTLIQGCKNTIIPNSVTSIGSWAFRDCTGLTSITIPNSVTTIGNSAFKKCTSLTNVTIGNSVTLIGNDAFYNCTGLTEMYVKANTPPSADYDTFYNVPKTIPVYVPAGTKAAYQAAAYWKNFTNIIEMDFCIKGDITGDESVDVGDITTLVSIILDDSLTADAADVNSDGSVDVGDITEVVNIILNPDNDDDTPAVPGTPTNSRAVDLGLSVKWASCNVGATAPEEYGGYYAWGEAEEKSQYYWETYKYCNGTYDSLTKYCTNSDLGTVDNKTTLEASDDVATVKWGGSWRMPTIEEQEELISKCTWQWTTLNGVKGYRVTGLNGNSIFLPAAGYRYGTWAYDKGSDGYYWSSSFSSSYSYYAYYLDFGSGGYDWGGNSRCGGRTVRPVCE